MGDEAAVVVAEDHQVVGPGHHPEALIDQHDDGHAAGKGRPDILQPACGGSRFKTPGAGKVLEIGDQGPFQFFAVGFLADGLLVDAVAVIVEDGSQ